VPDLTSQRGAAGAAMAGLKWAVRWAIKPAPEIGPQRPSREETRYEQRHSSDCRWWSSADFHIQPCCAGGKQCCRRDAAAGHGGVWAGSGSVI